MPETIEKAWRKIVDLWPIVVGMIGMLGGGAFVAGQLYYTINANTKAVQTLTAKVEASETDRLQWRALGSQGDRIVALETWREKIDALTQPEEIQEWGWIKREIRALGERLDDHISDTSSHER